MTAALKLILAQLLAKYAPKVVDLAGKALEAGLAKVEADLEKKLGA
jgi:hypothetical protein